MDVVRLNKDDLHRPDVLIEGYSSCIWTERYLEAGDFKLTTSAVRQTRDLLPVDSYISLLDTREVMIVENHEITEGTEGGEQLTVSGRSLEVIMQGRSVAKNWNGTPNPYVVANLSSAAAAALLMLNSFVSGSLSEHDILYQHRPRVAQLRKTYPNASTSTEAVELYQFVMDLIQTDKLGIRSIRPEKDGNGTIYLEIHDGAERNVEVSSDPVIFSVSTGDVRNPKYLQSLKDYKNVAYVFSPLGTRMVYAPGTPSNVAGLKRRVLTVNATDLTSQGDAPSIASLLEQRGLMELQKYNRKMYFDGEISPNSSYVYGKDYKLGDLVSLDGAYGVKETMMVTEHIRTCDKEGDRGYPTLTEVS